MSERTVNTHLKEAGRFCDRGGINDFGSPKNNLSEWKGHELVNKIIATHGFMPMTGYYLKIYEN